MYTAGRLTHYFHLLQRVALNGNVQTHVPSNVYYIHHFQTKLEIYRQYSTSTVVCFWCTSVMLYITWSRQRRKVFQGVKKVFYSRA